MENPVEVARRAAWREDQDRTASAVLECVHTLRLLETLIDHPETAALLGPFDQNIRRALEKFEEVRDLLTWMIYPNQEAAFIETPTNAPKEAPMSSWPTYDVDERVGSVFPGEFGTVKKTPSLDGLAPNNYVVAYDGRGDCLVHAKHMTKL